MAASRSIGSLVAFITADTAQLMKEFNKVDRQLARWSGSWTKEGGKLALGFLGMQNALTAVAGEVRNVVQNIESIPGVPAETQASIITMRDNLAAAKNWVDRVTAGIVAAGVKAAQAVGVGAASLMGYNDTASLSAQETPDEIARSKDPGFDAKIDAARKKMVEAKAAQELAAKSTAGQIVTLRAEAERYETFAKSSSINSVQRLEAQTTAQEKLGQANAKMVKLNEELDASQKKVAQSLTGAEVATLSTTEAIAGLEERKMRIQTDMGATSIDPNDPEALQRRIRLNNELADVQERLGKLYEKQGKLGKAVGDTIATSFENAIFTGGKLSDVLRGLAQDLARLLFRNMVTANLASWIAGGFNKMFSGAGSPPATDPVTEVEGDGGLFARGGAVAGGFTYRVNENGQELFKPDVGGTIIPIGSRGAYDAGNAPRGGTSYVFAPQIAAGVTRQDLAAMMPKMFEQFSAYVAGRAERGGRYRNSFAAA